MNDAALEFWTKRGRGGQQVALAPPSGYGESRWEPQRLIRYGLATRREVHAAAGAGHTVFKGENVSAARFTGSPTHLGLDVMRASSPSVWAYQHILPPRMYAIPLIEQVPVAAPFDPGLVAVLNTVVVFGPRNDLVDVPFDAVLLSSIYSWFYVIAGRRSFMNKIRSHIYPTAVAELPWNDAVAAHSTELTAARDRLLALCESRYEQFTKLRDEAAALGLRPLREVVRDTKGGTVAFNEAFGDEPTFTMAVGAIVEDGGLSVLPLDLGDLHTVAFNEPAVALLAAAGLGLLEGTEMSRTSILNALIPADDAMAARLSELRRQFEPEGLDQGIDAEIAGIDGIIGAALGLAAADIAEIRRDMADDPFLARVRPRYPYFRPRQYGRRVNLEREHRYATV